MTADLGTALPLALSGLDLARWAGAVALLLPIAIGAAWLTGGRRVEGFTIAVGAAALATVIALLGVALSFPTDLGGAVWLIAIGVVDAAVIAALGLFRRPRPARGTRPRLSAVSRGIKRQWAALLIGALAIAVTVAAVAIARDNAARTRQEMTFTQLWMLASKGGGSAAIGIRNLQDAPRTYRVRVAAPRGPLLSRAIRVPPGASRTIRVPLPLTRLPHRVTATAHAVGFPGERRTVDVWTHAPS